MGKHTQMSTNDQLDLVTTLERVYQCCRTKYHDFTATVIRPYDNLLVLTSHILWEVWHETMQDKYFWMAVTDLSDALKTSPASYNLRLLLIKFLNQIGAVGAANQFHYGLELKHVQLDSMGYVLSRHIQTCGHFESAISIFSQSLKFFTSNYKDVSIPKVPEKISLLLSLPLQNRVDRPFEPMPFEPRPLEPRFYCKKYAR